MLLVGGLLLIVLVASLPLLIPLAIGALSASTIALPAIAIAVGTPRQLGLSTKREVLGL